MDLEEGVTPAALTVLASYLLGEVISLICERRPDGRLAVKVHFYDYEGRELNEDPDEPGNDHQEYFTHYYFLSADGSRVTEIRDISQNLIEKDPLPWSLKSAVSGQKPATPGRRSRMSGLASRVA